MDSSTPYVSSSAQFTVGSIYNVDYSLAPGEELFIDTHTFSYESSTWDFSLTNVIVLDDNDTEINDTGGVEVFAQLREEGTSMIYTSIEMNYSIALDWYLELSLQSYDEDTYDLYVIASSSTQYGRELIDSFTISHILTVEKPDISLNFDNTEVYVTVNASYTQLFGWETFTENVQTLILLYDAEGTTVDSAEISYNEGTNDWGIATVDLSQVKGEHYIKVSFRYADRTVRSPESDHFMAEGEPPTTTGFLDFSPWYLMIIAISLVSLPVIWKRLRK
jgi:hypothetical protein